MKSYTPSSCALSLATFLLVTGVFGTVTWHAQAVAETSDTVSWKAPSFRARKKNPLPVTVSSIDTGRKFYLRDCMSCHGQTGHGDGPAAQYLPTVPGNLTDWALWKQSDGALFWKISEGRSPMPAFQSLLDEEERWHVVNYLRSLSPKPPVFEVPDLYRRATSRALSSYFKVASALFQDDPSAAREALNPLAAKLDDLAQISGNKLDEKPGAMWDDAIQQLRTTVQPLAKAQDLMGLRKGFKAFSNAMINLLDQFGHDQEQPLYQLRCDQAVDNEDDAWLQSDSKPQNPYLGQSKSQCGTVISQWRGP